MILGAYGQNFLDFLTFKNVKKKLSPGATAFLNNQSYISVL